VIPFSKFLEINPDCVGASLCPTEEINEAIKRWAVAKEQVGNNSALLLGKNRKAISVEIRTECAARTRNLYNAIDELLKFKGNPLAPKPLRIFFAADESAETACSSCWLSSSGPIHPDCGVRIEAYFDSERNLLRYAESLQETRGAVGYEVVSAK